VKIPDAQMTALETTGALIRHDWHPERNDTLNPQIRVVKTDRP